MNRTIEAAKKLGVSFALMAALGVACMGSSGGGMGSSGGGMGSSMSTTVIVADISTDGSSGGGMGSSGGGMGSSGGGMGSSGGGMS